MTSHSKLDEPEEIEITVEQASLFGYCIACGYLFEVTLEEMSAFLNDEGDLLCLACVPLAETIQSGEDKNLTSSAPFLPAKEIVQDD